MVVAAPKLNKFQTDMFRNDVLFGAETGIGGFTRHYLGAKPTITKDFEVDDTIMKSFRDYLAAHNVRYTEPELAENMDWLKRKIKQEVFMSTFGEEEGFKVLLAADPQVEKAAESIPQARALYQNARKIVAQRTGGATTSALEQP